MRNRIRGIAPLAYPPARTSFFDHSYHRPFFLITLAFIIPTLNEERNIGDTIDRIVEATETGWKREIIVVDNGSEDDTVKIAGEKGARVLSLPHESISALRNRGAAETTADVLLFIDGDVLVTAQWGKELKNAVSQLCEQPMQITGSVCGVTEQASWLERNWFDPALRRKLPGYVNSAHMIVTRRLFESLGGFDEQLETGEDVDFCERAKYYGARIVLNQKLTVIHKGFPSSLFAFFKREKWHAKGDYSSIQKMRSSKPALVSLILLLAFPLYLLIMLLTEQKWSVLLYPGLFVGACMASSIHRFGFTNSRWIKGSIVYSVYFTARSISLAEVLIMRVVKNNLCKQDRELTKIN